MTELVVCNIQVICFSVTDRNIVFKKWIGLCHLLCSYLIIGEALKYVQLYLPPALVHIIRNEYYFSFVSSYGKACNIDSMKEPGANSHDLFAFPRWCWLPPSPSHAAKAQSVDTQLFGVQVGTGRGQSKNGNEAALVNVTGVDADFFSLEWATPCLC